MNELQDLPFLSHIRTEPSTHVMHWRGGRLVRSGRGLEFWFRPINSSIQQVPVDDRELDLMFHGRTSDFQDVVAQGVVTYRIVDAERAAQRIDFTIDVRTGLYLRTPLEQVAALLTQHAQQYVWDYFTHAPLDAVLRDGVAQVRDRIRDGLAAETRIAELGIELVAVRVAAVRPSPDVEEALQTPERERIQQQADEATFHRRAVAVEKERAIQENELQNRIELAARQEQLVAQEGANARREAQELAAASAIESAAEAERTRVSAAARAESIRLVEGARAQTERELMAINAELGPQVLIAMAAREAAGNLGAIDHVTIGSDSLMPALAMLAEAGRRRLDGSEG